MHEEGCAKLADFNKRYASAKAKVRRLKKELEAMEKVAPAHHLYSISNYVRLAVNKFVLIDKRLKKHRTQRVPNVKRAIKALRASTWLEPNMITWHIGALRGSYRDSAQLVSEVQELLRITNGHLSKVGDTKKILARYNILPTGLPSSPRPF